MSHESKDLDSCGIRPTNCMYLVDPTIEMVNIQEFWAKRIHSRDDDVMFLNVLKTADT